MDEGSCCALCVGSKSQRTIARLQPQAESTLEVTGPSQPLLDIRAPPRELQVLFLLAKAQLCQHFPILARALCKARRASARLPLRHGSPQPAPLLLLSQTGSGRTDLTVRSRPLSPASLRGSGMFLIHQHLSKGSIGLFKALLA